MTLQDITKRYHELLTSYQKELDTVINSSCNKLVNALSALAEKLPFPEVEKNYRFKDEQIAINLRYICRVGIRYCGRFINMIIISKDEQLPPNERIELTFASYEDGLDNHDENYPDDMYFGEEADERYGYYQIEYDWNNFYNLVYQLKPFFYKAELGTIYKHMFEEIYQESIVLRKINDKITELITEELPHYMDNVIERHEMYKKNRKKHFILLPDCLSIRYKGRFHNCLIMDDYAFSLGYVQLRNFIAEECYHQDPYTVTDDSDRYLKRENKLLHEISFNHFHNGFNEVRRTLDDLIFLCGEDCEKLKNCSYLYQQSVDYPKTILTD